MAYSSNETETLLGTNIRKLRKFYKVPIKVMAERLEVNPDTILRWERGEIYPSAGEISRLQSFFNIPLDVLTRKRIVTEKEVDNEKL